MSHAEDLAQRYIHIWNETDPAGRRAQVAGLWIENGTSASPDAATMTGPSGGTRAAAQGYRYVVYGPDLHIPFAAATLITRRTVLNARAPRCFTNFGVGGVMPDV